MPLFLAYRTQRLKARIKTLNVTLSSINKRESILKENDFRKAQGLDDAFNLYQKSIASKFGWLKSFVPGTLAFQHRTILQTRLSEINQLTNKIAKEIKHVTIVRPSEFARKADGTAVFSKPINIPVAAARVVTCKEETPRPRPVPVKVKQSTQSAPAKLTSTAINPRVTSTTSTFFNIVNKTETKAHNDTTHNARPHYVFNRIN